MTVAFIVLLAVAVVFGAGIVCAELLRKRNSAAEKNVAENNIVEMDNSDAPEADEETAPQSESEE